MGGSLGSGGFGSWVSCMRRFRGGPPVPLHYLVCSKIFRYAILEWKVCGCVVWTKHTRLSLYRSLQHTMPSNLNDLHLHFSHLGDRFLDHVLCFLYRSTWKLSIGYFGHSQGQAHVGLFQLYLTSFPCHRSKHVECQHQLRCYFRQWNWATPSTI
jgi:hypothetical protein